MDVDQDRVVVARQIGREPRAFRAVAVRCPFGRPERYRAKVSGPLLDRLELQVELSALPFAQWAGEEGPAPEPSSKVRERVLLARAAAFRRQGAVNARLTPAQVRALAGPEEAGRRLLAAAARSGALSPRSLDRVLRVALTAADLAGARRPGREHVAEALQYRAFDREAGGLCSQ